MVQRPLTRSLAALTGAAALAVATSTAAIAQKTDWSEDQLEAYAAAVVEVDEIFSDYRPRIQNAESADEASALREEARSQAIQAVKNEGITVSEYTEINQAARADTELKKKVQDLIRQESR